MRGLIRNLIRGKKIRKSEVLRLLRYSKRSLPFTEQVGGKREKRKAYLVGTSKR